MKLILSQNLTDVEFDRALDNLASAFDNNTLDISAGVLGERDTREAKRLLASIEHLEDIEITDEMIAQENLELGIEVTHHV